MCEKRRAVFDIVQAAGMWPCLTAAELVADQKTVFANVWIQSSRDLFILGSQSATEPVIDVLNAAQRNLQLDWEKQLAI